MSIYIVTKGIEDPTLASVRCTSRPAAPSISGRRSRWSSPGMLPT